MVVILISIKSFSQNTLTGKITDQKTHEPIIGAVVYLHDLKTGAVTGVDGHFSITRLPKGKFLLEISYTSYKTKISTIEINGPSLFNAELEQTVSELHEVVVTGVSSATHSGKNPTPTTVVNKTTLLENASTNLIDAISRQPGISQISTGPAISKPNIRGLGYNRIVTLYNGMRQEGQQWGDEHGIEIDEFSIDRVEIVKGPGSIMYGSDALAGVINMLSASPLPEGKINGSVITNYQTNNHLFGYSLVNSGNIKGINWQVRFSSKQAGNYQNKYDSIVYNSGFKEWDLNGYVGINRKWGYSHLHFSSFNQTIAMTDGNRDSSGHFLKYNSLGNLVTANNDLSGYSINNPYQLITHNRIFLVNQFIIGQSKLGVNVGLQLNQRKEFSNPVKPNEYGMYLILPTLNYDVKYYLPEMKGWKTSFGVGGMVQQNKNMGSELLIPDYYLYDAGIFLYEQKQFDKLNFSGGVRYDYRYLKTNDLLVDANRNQANNSFAKFNTFNATYANYSASAGVTYEFNSEFLAKVNVSRGFRAPDIAALTSNGIHEGNYRVEWGKQDLHPETSLQFDAGIELNTEHVTVELNGFQNTIQNYIFLKGTGFGITDLFGSGPLYPVYQYTQGTAKLYGGEFSIDVHPHPWDWLHFENSFSIVKAENVGQPDSSKYLPFIPAPRTRSELRANFNKHGDVFRNSYIKVEADYFFQQNQILLEGNTETTTKAYLLIHAGLGTDAITKKGTKICTIYLSVNNVLDEVFQDHLSRLKYAPINPATGRMGIYNMGRNFSIKLLIPLNFKN